MLIRLKLTCTAQLIATSLSVLLVAKAAHTATLIAATGVASSATNAATSSTPPPKKSTTDDLTKEALKRAQLDEAKREQQADVSTSGEQVGPIFTKPVINSAPAPGTSTNTAAGAAASQTSPVQNHVPTTPEKARELIMTSHVQIGGGEDDDSDEASAIDPGTSGTTAAGNLTARPAATPVESRLVKTIEIEPPGVSTNAIAPSPSNGVSADATPRPVTAAVAKVVTHTTPKGVPAEQSLKWLTNGNTRYTKKHFRADGRDEKDRLRVWKAGQKPHAIVLSCSDSVVPPEVVFDQTIGEIYVVRTLGEIVDSSSLASLEYAVEYLGPQLLVVMGHTKCDAIQGILQIHADENAGSEFLNRLLTDIRGHLTTLTTEKPSPNLEIESTVNADGVARDLIKRSELIRKKVEAGELVIKSALYRGDSGKVNFY